MIAKQLLSDVIPSLKTSDTGEQALAIMGEYRVAHLPVVNDADFLGLICDTDIYNMDSFDESIENYHISLDRSYVIESQHVSDVIRAFGSGKLTLLPVLNEKKQYLGVITLAHLVQSLASVLPVSNPGGVLVLEINEKDYVLTEIAQIVESNDAKILFMYIRSFPDSTKLEVTL
ncbi:MAG: CBS domain-containing protein, partial [Bacteroidota bacterium]|nr:CBS domain-containing protein [Bacteroidota bacterium]